MTGVGSANPRGLVVRGSLDDAGDAGRVHLDDGRADAVGSRVNGDLAAVRRIGRLVNVVHAEQRGWMAMVQLDDDLVGLVAEGGRASHRGCEHDAAAGGQVAGLHHGPMHRAQKAVARHLRHQRQVHVEEAGLAGVDARAQTPESDLVGRAEADGVGLGQRAVERGAGGSAGEHADLKLAAGLMLRDGPLGDGRGDGFGRAGRSEAAEADGLAVLDQRGSLLGG